MAEWLKAHAWKACIRETVSWVRIPLSPPARRMRGATREAEMNRREALVQGSCAALAMLLGTAEARAAAREQTAVIARSAIPVRPESKPLPFDLFYDLSRYITANATLDTKVANLHFEHFRREEWGWVTAARL